MVFGNIEQLSVYPVYMKRSLLYSFFVYDKWKKFLEGRPDACRR